MTVTYTGAQNYSISMSRFTFIELPTFDLTFTEYTAVTKVEVSSPSDKQINIKVFFKDVSTPEVADSISRLIANRIADRLAFEFKISAAEPFRGDASFQKNDGSGQPHIVCSTTFGLGTSGYLSSKIPVSSIPNLSNFLIATEPSKEAYYSMFRSIMQVEDPVSRFMQLYGALVALKGPHQRAVDTFISTCESTVQMIYCNHCNRNVTLYTNLRNQLAHPAIATPLANVNSDMKLHSGRLADHVKTAISQLP